MRMLVAIFLTLASSAALAQNNTYRITGTLLNAVTGEPIRRATVSALALEDRHAVVAAETDDVGHFSLVGLPEGKYPLSASKPGFLTSAYDEHEGFSTAIVTGNDQQTDALVFVLTPNAQVYGVITGDGGDPVEGATVMLFHKPHSRNPGDRITHTSTATTDDTGAYEFGNLAPGEYLLAVKAEPWFAVHRTSIQAQQRSANDPGAALDVAYPVTYFDATTDEKSASSIDLAGGNSVEANLTLNSVPALRIAVETEARPGNFQVPPLLESSIFGIRTGMNTTTVTDPNKTGIAEFYGVAPGHYFMAPQGSQPHSEFDVTSNQRIGLKEPDHFAAVTGGIQTTSGKSPDIMLLKLEPRNQDSSKELTLQGCGQAPECQKGSFQFASVTPGNWDLTVFGTVENTPFQPMPVLSITIDGKPHAGSQLTVADKPLTLSVLVSESVTSIEGFTRKGEKGKAGAMIVLVPKDLTAMGTLARRDQSDSDGSFALPNVAPGQYTVVAIENGWGMDWARPAVIARYLAKGVTISVPENSGKTIKLSQSVPAQSR